MNAPDPTLKGLQLNNLTVEINHKRLVDDVSFNIRPGELAVILGSNGAGKSTLIKCIAGLQAFDQGTILWNNSSLTDLHHTDRARTLSYLPQQRPTTWPILVEPIVALGRYAYGANSGKLNQTDQEIVDVCINACDLSHLRQRRVDTLSGGEQARVHCARTFASQSPLLLADEPTTSLDPKHQLEVMYLLQQYVKNDDQDVARSAIVILHEPNLAARFADQLIWMKDSQLIAKGSVNDTFNAQVLQQTYDVEATVHYEGTHPYVEITKAM